MSKQENPSKEIWRNLAVPPTFAEFLPAVKADFKQRCYIMTDQEAEMYLDSKMEYIQKTYDSELKAFAEGRITFAIFFIDRVKALAHSLEVMCDPLQWSLD